MNVLSMKTHCKDNKVFRYILPPTSRLGKDLQASFLTWKHMPYELKNIKDIKIIQINVGPKFSFVNIILPLETDILLLIYRKY